MADAMPASTDEHVSDEQRQVFKWRFDQARAIGLTHLEARLFAESSVEIRLLRLCAQGGCPPATAARILC